MAHPAHRPIVPLLYNVQNPFSSNNPPDRDSGYGDKFSAVFEETECQLRVISSQAGGRWIESSYNISYAKAVLSSIHNYTGKPKSVPLKSLGQSVAISCRPLLKVTESSAAVRTNGLVKKMDSSLPKRNGTGASVTDNEPIEEELVSRLSHSQNRNVRMLRSTL
ncbi:hypothetical protein V9T40_004149 [Parthenolecanium corni]|uniref:Uncharacterized protein n=1 Tax=Parthenolecanium corni TaxID=536013 RepID=A0AAN9Y9A9_9HEMI